MKITGRGIRLAVAAVCAASVAAIVGPGLAAWTSSSAGVTTGVTGGGHYLLLDLFSAQFAFSAIQHGNGRASGRFHHRVELTTGTVDFHAEVTCLAVDPALGRAWIGGVILSNDSTDPAFNTAIHQPGHDIWFRVLDNGQGQDPDDRTTFVGFEGVIPSSESYCQQRIWPDGNARTWTVAQGNISIHP